jgi:hypothetical protein
MRQKLTLILGVCCAFAGLLLGAALLQAQTSSEWSEPVNLSQSGATTGPFMAVEPGGKFHVFWQDTYEEMYMYSQGQGSEWSSPISATLPFSMVVPHLLIDGNGRAHAFWLNEDSLILYSSAPLTNVTQVAAWTPKQTLADSAVKLDVALDETGQLHLLYLRPDHTAAAPAGIYSRRTADGGQLWEPATLLYQSSYFRGLKGANANVELTAATEDGQSWLFAAWDNRARKQVFLARSGDGGQSWEAPLEVAGPESGSSSVLPFGIQVGAKGNDVVVLWSNGQPGTLCRQFYQASSDFGATWQERQQMEELLPGMGTCTSDHQFMVGDEYTFLLSKGESQSFLWAWDGQQWSEPRPQLVLTGFDNPQTLNVVVFRCQQTAVTHNQLTVIGCDETLDGSNDGDIWQLSRSLGSAVEWFPPPSLWTAVTPITTGEERFFAQTIIATGENSALAFWTLADVSGAGLPEIYLSSLEEESWSLPQEVLKSPEGVAGTLSAVLNDTGQLYLTWGTHPGQLYLVRTDVAAANLVSAWSPPELITATEGISSNPVLAFAGDNVLYLAYTIAVNEGRGVYLLQSADSGRSWSEPVLVFDGASAGWEVVGPARLAVTDDGQIHVMWGQQSLAAANPMQAQALYYAHSNDGGQTFSPAMLVSEGLFTWYALAAAGQTLHQLWQSWAESAATIQHTYSLDSGQTWNRPAVIDSISGPVAVTQNDVGQLFLLHLTDTAVGEWYWKGNSWELQAGVNLKQANVDKPGQNLSASVSSDGWLTTLFDATVTDAEAATTLHHLLASSRVVTESASVLPTPALSQPITITIAATSALTATQSVEAAVTPSPVPEVETATAVPAIPVINSSANAAPDNSLFDLLLSFLPALLLVLLILAFGLRALWLRRN